MPVRIKDIVEEFNLKVYSQGSLEEEAVHIEVNRCGLQLSGYYDYFEEKRIQVIGKAENSYLYSLSEADRKKSIDKILSHNIPCLIFTSELAVENDIICSAQNHKKWLLGASKGTSAFLLQLSTFLQHEMAESTNYHGVLVDVYGVGVLITGESGIGKSETALELIRNGHLLIADDYVIIKKIESDVLIGTGGEITKNLIEIRGLGILDIKSMFGLSAIRIQKNIEIVINLEPWDEAAYYDRVGLEYEKIQILDVELPYIRVPVRPGRNLAAIIEIAALNYRQNLMGYNAAKQLDDALKGLNSN